MKTPIYHIVNANQAVAKIAYKTNEVCPIYPITPASEMSELVEQWSAEKRRNIFGSIPTTFEMQSEAGVAGTMHGALQTGSLSTTFTASQGLLLMLPNMYKIAGELTPNVIHVATRSIATHALSVFGDHSDIMAVRQSGYAMLGSGSVQEAQDFALISQVATLQSKVPFVHFFDGFRTSHEISKIEVIPDGIIQFMMNNKDIMSHRERALNPNNPVIRGTSQGPDVFFQTREAINSFYDVCPDIVQDKMNAFAELTGRQYKLFDYVGHPEAQQIIISMASSTETIEETITFLNSKGAKYGLIKVRLFRPFSTKHLIKALPKTVQSITVLDRTKEPGSTGEPLYLDVLQSVSEAFQTKEILTFPRIVGGRYGLSSKEFTPNMVAAIFHNLKQEQPKNNFTIGINDDVKNTSLDYSSNIQLDTAMYQAIFHQQESTQDISELAKLIGSQDDNFVQSYSECDYKKSNSIHSSYLRIASSPIKAPYLINNANFIALQHVNFINSDTILNNIQSNGTLLVNSSLASNAFWQALTSEIQERIIDKNISLYIVNSSNLKSSYVVKEYSISILQAAFLALNNEFISEELPEEIIQNIIKVDTENQTNFSTIAIKKHDSFSSTMLGKLLENKGNDIPVSGLPSDGTFASDTSKFNSIQLSEHMPIWDAEACTQCGACSMACPQAALRIKVFDDGFLETVPRNFKCTSSNEFDLLNYTIQINSEQCNSCNNCIDACFVNALDFKEKQAHDIDNWNYFETIPEFDRTKIDVTKVSQQQLQEPLFKYSNGVEGCGEAPYLKLMSQLFGDRLLVANATGSSSIFGGALPTTPWSKNNKGQGPAWSNSLFEDNAEFGLGFRLSITQQEEQAKDLLKRLSSTLDLDLVTNILNASQQTEIEISDQRGRVELLKEQLKNRTTFEAKQLLLVADNLVEKSVWIVGGDGWAYDIGYGGLDHVIASGENVNILVLDNEVYDNTGGQTSKSTPFGAEAKFSFGGKQKKKKDLGLMAMNYDNVYVASVAIGADQEQALKAFNEAESFKGPSIIIAYCHSESHGIDMNNPSQFHKKAVASGQWLLYRNDPRKSSSFQLDSKNPSINIKDYLKSEKRFENFLKNQETDKQEIINQLQYSIDKRFKKHKMLTHT
ncbi:thiamine pyrophosphate-dependent enzyme [Lacinutrix iliipiscaria]|uniref:Thiamine pyrophosphate-dependent enzyme n=1 Tax=Lacinutrix iliipiscaria TaxID=1230532 RepID=A0ABW5WSK6_9FLAO